MRLGGRRRVFSAGLLSCLSTYGQAAGPYAVDDAAIGNPGECQVESWISAADSGDLVAVAQPLCVVKLGIPVELTATLQPVRVDGEWADLKGLQIKFIVLRLAGGDIVVATTAGTLLDVGNGESLTLVNLPMTVNVGEGLRLNVNAGWLSDTAADSSHLFMGLAAEWDFRSSWTLIAEVFGQTGAQEEPRMQAGLRYAPTKDIDVDIIYGYNIAGEHASWTTAGLTVRF
jgi:hypothetical protein